MSALRTALAAMAGLTLAGAATTQADGEAKLRIIAFGGHPDDCELQAGGVAPTAATRSSPTARRV